MSQEDTILLSEKQENINTKLAQLDEMTRKVQRIIGLSDPSSYEFAKMFEMLPYPHKKEVNYKCLLIFNKEKNYIIAIRMNIYEII